MLGVKDWFSRLPSPLLTCEAVIAEACFLLRGIDQGATMLLTMISDGALSVSFRLGQEILEIKSLISKYGNIPMSLADACLVRMAEQHGSSKVMTLDNDFTIYRKHGRQVIPLILPKNS